MANFFHCSFSTSDSSSEDEVGPLMRLVKSPIKYDYDEAYIHVNNSHTSSILSSLYVIAQAYEEITK